MPEYGLHVASRLGPRSATHTHTPPDTHHLAASRRAPQPSGAHDLALHRDGRASGRRDALGQDGRLGLEAVGAAEGVEEAC
eukprot:scaffold63223_cov63-Phaeocystis_antarctica.AAC.3